MKVMKICSAIIGVFMICTGLYCVLNPGIIMTSIGIFIGLGVIVAGANILTLATIRIEG